MNSRARRVLFWSPRILTIAFAFFLSIFALDVFGEANGFAATALALLIHLIPTLLILLVLVIAWRREWIATLAFMVLGVAYVTTSWGRFPLSVYFVIAGPLFLIAALFQLSWVRREGLRDR